MKNNILYNEDWAKVIQTIPDNYFNLVILDPPYFQILKEKWDNQWKTEEEYFLWIELLLSEVYRVTKEDGSIYIWNWFDKIFDIGVIAKKQKYNIRNLITWNRGGGRERNNWSSAKEELLYLTIDKNNFTFNNEDILVGLDDPSRKLSKSSWERKEYKTKDRKEMVNPTNVWYNGIVHSLSPEKVDHPSQKPLSVCDRIIKASSNKNDIVFIPFAGSGSEIVSCINNERQWIATETNEKYCNLIEDRIEKNGK